MPSTIVWKGGGAAVQQVNTVTPASVGIGNSFLVTRNGKSVTFVATAATVANVTAGLQAALSASPEPEFRELIAADKTTYLEIRGPSDGTPITQTSSASGGTAMNVTATATAASGPHDFNTAANWSGGAVPGAGDTVVIDESSGVPGVYYGLDQNAITFGAIRHTAGAVGLPATNPAGYAEDRPQFLKVGGVTNGVTVGGGSAGRGVTRLRLDANGAAMTVNVVSTGTPDPRDNAGQAVQVKGLAAGSVVNVTTGSVGLAVGAGETATVDNLRVGGGVVRGGLGLTLAALSQSGGDVTLANGVTGTAAKTGGKLTMTGGAVATMRNDGGQLYWDSSAAITTALNTGSGGETYFTRDLRPRTVAACTVQKGAKLRDGFRTVTWTAGVVLDNCSIDDVDLDLGTHVTLTVAAGP